VDIGANEIVSGLDDIPPLWGGLGMYAEFTTIAEFNIDSNNLTLKLGQTVEHLYDDKVVSWGDGSVTYGEFAHTYATTGKYIVKGKFWFSNTALNWGTRITKLLKVPYGIDINLYWAFNSAALLESVNLTNARITRAAAAFRMYICRPAPILTEIIFNNTRFLYGCSLDQFLCDNSALKEIDVSGMIFEGNNAVSNMFARNTNLREIRNLTSWDTTKTTSFKAFFENCTSLVNFDFSGCDFSNVTELTNFVYSCSRLSDIKAPSNIKVSLSNFTNSTSLTADHLMDIINNLSTVSTTQTLTIGSANLAKLTAEQIKVATDKNWSVV
jgi:hypothetical protein